MKTVVIGASPNPARYSNMAVERLLQNNHEVIPLGIRKGEISGLKIITERPEIKDVHTVTMYVGPQNQPEWYNYILSLNPERVIFNPGTENPEFEEILEKKGIEVRENCTLVLLATNQF
jgi:predicted CoA-binding protein